MHRRNMKFTSLCQRHYDCSYASRTSAIAIAIAYLLLLLLVCICHPVQSFQHTQPPLPRRLPAPVVIGASPRLLLLSQAKYQHSLTTLQVMKEQEEDEDLSSTTEAELLVNIPAKIDQENVWEWIAKSVINVEEDPGKVRDFVQLVTILRVGVPSVGLAALAKLLYPSVALWLASIIDDSGAFAVISQDSSQYIQNILTTSGLAFSILVGQTYYFMYQQQEAIYLALYEEVTMAKSLLEQLGLVSQGRSSLYQRMLECMNLYVQEDLQKFNDFEPAVMLSARPVDDPLEDILYLTSVGEPSVVYQTVRSLRQARSHRLGALQRKLPPIHMTLLWTLAAIVLCSFPLLGAGAQTIGGLGILTVQSWYISFIVFGICLVMGVIHELQRPAENGAYNARTVLQVMVAGLEEELRLRLSGDFVHNTAGPTLDINRNPPPFFNPGTTTAAAAAVLPLETAEERWKSSPAPASAVPLPSTVVDVETSFTTKSNNSNGGGGQDKSHKKGFRQKMRNWGINLLESSLTKFK